MQRIALVYDWLDSAGGAERILKVFSEMYPEADWYTLVYDPEHASFLPKTTVHTSFLQKLPHAKRFRPFLAPLMPIAWEQFSFDSYDIVISITSGYAKGLLLKPHTKHFCYLLTPPRYLWTHTNEYLRDYFNGWKTLFRPLAQLLFSYLKTWDYAAAHRPDVIIPISEVVKKRVQTLYKDKVHCHDVIYPPVDYQFWSAAASDTPTANLARKPRIQSKGYALVVARLVPYKRLDYAILACQSIQMPLVLVGDGPDMTRLKQMAAQTTHFVGNISDEALRDLYAHALVTLCPGIDDFGLTAVESMAAGTPAIVHSSSGNAEAVLDSETGYCVELAGPHELADAVVRTQERQWSRTKCQRRAKEFDIAACISQWKELV